MGIKGTRNKGGKMKTTMLLCLHYYNLWAHYRVLKIVRYHYWSSLKKRV
jgi:hypothetical protein